VRLYEFAAPIWKEGDAAKNSTSLIHTTNLAFLDSTVVIENGLTMFTRWWQQTN
jgi:hypothetical protein